MSPAQDVPTAADGIAALPPVAVSRKQQKRSLRREAKDKRADTAILCKKHTEIDDAILELRGLLERLPRGPSDSVAVAQVAEGSSSLRAVPSDTASGEDEVGVAICSTGNAVLTTSGAARTAVADEAGDTPAIIVDDARTRSMLYSAFGVIASDQSGVLLPAHGPDADVGMGVISKTFIRSDKYNSKFLPQEYSLLHKVWALLGGDCTHAVCIDIGAGRACCATLAAAILGLTVICVEKDSRPTDMRAEEILPASMQHLVVRLESDITQVDFTPLRALCAKRGLTRVVILAKHLCGVATDWAIDWTAQLRSQSLELDVLGMAMATCCMNKLSSDNDRVQRVTDFCSLYASVLPEDSAAVERVVELISRHSVWRSIAEGKLPADSPVTLRRAAWAESFEDALQALRMQRLRCLFGDARQVLFAPRRCTPQDRCLIAGGALSLSSIFDYEDTSFIARLEAGCAAFQAMCGDTACQWRPVNFSGNRPRATENQPTTSDSDAEAGM